MSTDTPLLDMTGIDVRFGPVQALHQAGLRLYAGEVHALMGENGAGKSTLIKALTGVNPVDAGEIRLAGAPVRPTGPADAQSLGISTVYQEVNLCANLSVAENVLLGREPRRFGRIDARAMRATAAEVLDGLGVHVDPASTLSQHSLAVQQLVAIARAVAVDTRVLVLDEPTSSLDAGEVAELFRVIRSLRDTGVAVLFVSHFLDQVYELSDRMTVLRNGRVVGEYRTAELPRLQLVSAMVGRELDVLEELDREPATPVEDAVAVVRAVGIGRRGAVEPVDLTVRPGEVVGLAGLLGSGRTELARLLFGADRADTGEIEIDGVTVRVTGPRSTIGAGVAFCSEDRKAEGVVGDLTVRDNLVLAMQAARGWLRRVPRREADDLVDRWIGLLDIRPADPDALLRNLSGGNQQKVLLARWLVTGPRLIILDEPTRGIDVGAKAQIQRLVADLARQGMAVVYISAELEEVARLSDRVLVLRDRRPVAELSGEDVRMDRIMELIAGGAT